MIFKNNNKAIIKKLTNRTLKYNKIRNIMAVIAIVLTTTLFTALFTISTGIVNTVQEQTMRQSGGSAHGTLKYLKNDEFNKLRSNPNIKQIEYSKMVGMAENRELLKHHTEIRFATDEDAKMNFSYPTKGTMPRKINELATDTMVLDLLGISKEIGKSITINYSINNKKFSRKFVLVGYWEHDKVSPASMIYVSKKFTDDIFKNFNTDIKNKNIGTGLIFADIMFKNSFNLERKMQKVITESGYSVEKNDNNYIAYGVNWAYMSTNFKLDLVSILSITAIIVLIIFTGYLIIYNIFQISIFKDIRFYGLLKTIGTTSKQIKKIIRKQAFLLSTIGIPIGLIIGFILGAIFLPMIFRANNNEKAYVSFSPMIFIGATLFSYVTVFISSIKPAKIAGNVSPIEAVRYTGAISNNERTIKNSSRGGKIYRMALSNITRNKKKTCIVIISMSLSLILLNSVFTLSKGFDMDKYISKFLSTDFVIGHANYFNKNHFKSKVDEVSPKMIEKVEYKKGFTQGGKIYYNLQNISIIQNSVENLLQLYGMEDFPLSQLNIVEGKLDLKKFKSDNYIIEGVRSNDNGDIQWEKSKYNIGDKVTLKFQDGTRKSYKVMAKAELKNTFDVRYSVCTSNNVSADTMYLPSNEFNKIVKDPVIMSYIFNVDKNYIKNIEGFLKEYSSKVEPLMNYESKNLFVSQFKDMQNMVLTIGGALSFIIGTIGILNFINSILTSIISRRREFAMLQSVGMTDRQLYKLVMYEGFFYAFFTIVIGLVMGSIFSCVVIKKVMERLWFCSYKFVILPLLIASPLLIVISLVIPFIIYRYSNNQTIVERLQELE
ncbi:ABC transporter permease [Clostridium botulinum]|uniref:ABC transporter permease n=4 Tax=Clostridium botulinum TaxID=1491 RepID=UPI0006932839|nr:ABC transporter permease [Clostridium botulinum]